jgi:DNA-binding NarL/FixJ family response regulator
MPNLRILVVDDYEPFRRIVRSILQLRDDLEIVGEASDGLEAFQRTQQLRPDLVILDVGLPKLNGIQVARRLCDLVPGAKILFLSVESDPDVVQEAFRSGAMGYVHKLKIQRELLPALDAILNGEQFVGSGLKSDSGYATTQDPPSRHDMLIYSNDTVLLRSVVRFIANALSAGTPAIVIATQRHRERLIELLNLRGFHADSAVRKGTFISVDAVEILSKIMVNGVPDRVMFFERFAALIETVAKAADTKHSRVAIYGECGGLLYAEGNLSAVVSIEETGKALARTYNIDALCSYPLLQGQESDPTFKCVCAEHTAVSFV